MPTVDASTASTGPGTDRRPREDEIDSHGLTHTGKVRRENQDHFLLCYLRRQLVVRASSVPDADGLLGETTRLASLAMVADGVGGSARGETASRVALTAVTKYVTRSLRCYYGAWDSDQEFYDALQQGARQSHAELLRYGEEDPAFAGMATVRRAYAHAVAERYRFFSYGDAMFLTRNNDSDTDAV